MNNFWKSFVYSALATIIVCWTAIVGFNVMWETHNQYETEVVISE